MTIYGGKKTVGGLPKDGFLVICTKCGWHSKVEMYADGPYVVLSCNHCGNRFLHGGCK